MNRNRSLRQLLATTCDKASKHDTARESTSVTREIRFGDFKIDLYERIVTLRDRELWLTLEEFDALVFRASQPRSLVTPQTMLAKSSTANQHGQTKFLT
jgi:DNA-binding response OmpR family regulator